MKKKFRIYEELNNNGTITYFVKQLFLGVFWATPSFSPLIYRFYSPRTKEFYNMEDVRTALAEVKEVMEKQKKSYVKIVEYVTIEV